MARIESLPTTDEVFGGLRDVVAGMTTDLHERLGSLPTTDEIVGAVGDLLAGMSIELDVTDMETLIHVEPDDVPDVAVPASRRASTAGESGEADVARSLSGGVTTPASEGVVSAPSTPSAAEASINASLIADQVPEPGVGHPDGAGRSGRANPNDLSSRVADRRSSDRAVDDVPVLVRLASRR